MMDSQNLSGKRGPDCSEINLKSKRSHTEAGLQSPRTDIVSATDLAVALPKNDTQMTAIAQFYQQHL
jgi:hypothetical protein